MDKGTATELWKRIETRLSDSKLQWHQRIADLRQVPAVQARATGLRLGDNEIFKSLVLAVLSNSTDWAKVERTIPDLTALFQDFRIQDYAYSKSNDIDQKVSWFISRRAGSMTLRQDLNRMIVAAKQLLILVQEHGSLEKYLDELMLRFNGDASVVAVALGDPSSSCKLSSLGIPLAAEFLKNVGYDVCKPDRHINRAVGSFGWVQFRRWPDRSARKPPEATAREMQGVMQSMTEVAGRLGLLATYVDNAVWLLCAKSGLSLSNEELASLIVDVI
jgi:3-methyladenine DNA glycosylase Tag